MVRKRHLPSLLPGLLAVVPGLLAAVSLSCRGGLPRAEAPDSGGSEAQVVSRLVAGKTARGELAPGERREYLLELPAGAYLRVAVGQQGSDLAARLLDPAGKTVRTADDWRSLYAPEVLEAVTPAAGTYLLEVQALPGLPAAPYWVAVEEVRSGRPEEKERLREADAGRQALARAEELRGTLDLAQLAEARDAAAVALTSLHRAADRDGEALALTTLGRIAKASRQPEAARCRFEEALAVWWALGNPAGQALAHNELGLLARELNRSAEALESYRRALTLWREASDPREEINALNNMGVLYRRTGRVDKALSSYEEALNLAVSIDNPQRECLVRNRLGTFRFYLGDVREALELHREALQLCREAGDRQEEASALSNLGVVYHALGRHQAALDAYARARRLAREEGSTYREAIALLNLGTVYLDLTDAQAALEAFEGALDIFRSTSGAQDKVVQALGYTGWLFRQQGLHRQALERFQEAWELSRGLDEPRVEAGVQYALGVGLRETGDTAQAVERLEEALALQVEVADRVGEIATRMELARTLIALRDPETARSHLQRALALSLRVESRARESRVLALLARLDRDEGELRAAATSMERALTLVDSLRSSVVDPALRDLYFASRRADYDLYLDLLMRLEAASPGTGYLERALQASEASRARGLLELLAEARVRVEEGVAPELKAREEELSVRQSALQSNLMALLSEDAAEAAKAEDLRSRLAQVQHQRAALEVRIRQTHPRYAEVQYPAPLGPERIEALLDGETALLEYAVGEEETYLFVVTDSGVEAFHLGPTADLRQAVEEAWQGLSRGGRGRFGRQLSLAEELYRKLVHPAWEVLASKRHLVVVPDSFLYYLPFETLLTEPLGSGGRPAYLLRRWTVSYVPSATVLAGLVAEREDGGPGGGPAKELVAFADPVYGRDADGAGDSAGGRVGAAGVRGARLDRLPGSGREVQEIASLFPGDRVVLYTREDASERNVKTSPYLPWARWVHFATHGVLDAESWRGAGLRLSHSEGTEDGLLQLHEIFNLEYRLHAELLVLSACESGLGKDMQGEGLVGLSRAFMYAGASSLVVSLWRIDDDSTAELMVRFYRHLQEGESHAEALRSAKLEMLDEAGYPLPSSWAPFVLIGLWQ